MSKIICDICGTSYLETAKCCPICGCSRETVENLSSEELIQEETAEEIMEESAETSSQKKKDIFDFDEVNTVSEQEEEEDEDDYDEEEDEDEARPNTFVVILLTILIVCLLVAAGFIFVRYFLPNLGSDKSVPTTEAVQQLETTEAAAETVPCEYMTMNNQSKAELNEIGQQFLLNVIVKPENTTDEIVFTSADESIATVSADGKITAVAEGETTIYISCGKNSMECPVVVKYVPETTAATEAPVEETVPETTGSEETTPAEETVPEETVNTAVDPNVVLKLKKTDIKLGVYYYVTLQLDCDLEPTQVEWSSEHPHIAKVDENGVVTALQEGTTAIIAKYGDQEVQCMVRCGWY